MSIFKKIGPGPFIAAAFIGPGTVTLCSLAGAQFGFALLWTLLFAVLATGLLQEMSARLGLISRKGLSEIIIQECSHPILKVFAIILILSAIVIGNAAYEAGNIGGAVLGISALWQQPQITLGNVSFNILSPLIGGLAFIILFIGNYKLLERLLIILVVFMSLAFIVTAIMTKPSLSNILQGLFQPSFPKGSWLTIIGLIGTTVVPYNLFLHANLAKEKWQSAEDLSDAKRDTWIAVIIGGLISLSIIIAAASIQGLEINNAVDLSKALEPLFGEWSHYFIALGLFAAGITSAITAPLAAAYVVSGCFSWHCHLQDKKFRAVWMSVLLLGIIVSSLNVSLIHIIKFAQATNGLLLPIIALFLFWIMNKKNILSRYTNSRIQNALGILVISITLFVGLKGIFKAFGWSFL